MNVNEFVIRIFCKSLFGDIGLLLHLSLHLACSPKLESAFGKHVFTTGLKIMIVRPCLILLGAAVVSWALGKS